MEQITVTGQFIPVIPAVVPVPTAAPVDAQQPLIADNNAPIADAPPSPNSLLGLLTEFVANKQGLTAADLLGERRIKSHAKARQMVWAIARSETVKKALGHQLPFEEIGRHFYRHNTTVLHGVQRVEQNPDLKNRVDELEAGFFASDVWQELILSAPSPGETDIPPLSSYTAAEMAELDAAHPEKNAAIQEPFSEKLRESLDAINRILTAPDNTTKIQGSRLALLCNAVKNFAPALPKAAKTSLTQWQKIFTNPSAQPLSMQSPPPDDRILAEYLECPKYVEWPKGKLNSAENYWYFIPQSLVALSHDAETAPVFKQLCQALNRKDPSERAITNITCKLTERWMELLVHAADPFYAQSPEAQQAEIAAAKAEREKIDQENLAKMDAWLAEKNPRRAGRAA